MKSWVEKSGRRSEDGWFCGSHRGGGRGTVFLNRSGSKRRVRVAGIDGSTRVKSNGSVLTQLVLER